MKKLPDLLAIRKEDVPKGQAIPANATEGSCAICDAIILLAPSSLREVLAKRVRPICPQCAKGEWDRGKSYFPTLADGAAEEYREYKQQNNERN